MAIAFQCLLVTIVSLQVHAESAADAFFEKCRADGVFLCNPTNTISSAQKNFNQTNRDCGQEIMAKCNTDVVAWCTQQKGARDGCLDYGVRAEKDPKKTSIDLSGLKATPTPASATKPASTPAATVSKRTPAASADAGTKAKTDKNADNSGGQSGADSTPTGANTQDQDGDRQSCRTAMTKTQNSCRDQSGGAGTMTSSGINDACKDIADASDNAATQNQAMAMACYNARLDCQSTCGDLATKYEGLGSAFDATAQVLRSNEKTCNSYANFTTTAMAQASATRTSSVSGEACKSAASASPASGSGSGSSSKSDMNTASTEAPTSAACQANSALAGCSQAAGAQAGQAAADALAQLSPATTPSTNYNTGDNGGVSGSPNLGGASGQQNANGTTVHPIANNTGGGLMGGAGGGGNGGILGGNGGGGLFGGNAKSGIADIDQGLRSGGYTSTPGEDEKPDASGGFAGYGAGRDPASAPDGQGGLDLKAYLPGGRLAADTLRAGAMQMQALGIHPAHIDMWSRISEKIQQKCHLGELLDCN